MTTLKMAVRETTPTGVRPFFFFVFFLLFFFFIGVGGDFSRLAFSESQQQLVNTGNNIPFP